MIGWKECWRYHDLYTKTKRLIKDGKPEVKKTELEFWWVAMFRTQPKSRGLGLGLGLRTGNTGTGSSATASRQLAIILGKLASFIHYFPTPVVIQLLVSRIERHKAWLDCFFGFVSLAIQRLPYFSPHFPVPRFPVPRFLLPRYQRPLNNTQHCIYIIIWASRNRQWTINSLKL